MANDVYGQRQMYVSGGALIFIIPFGMILIFLIYDFCMNMYMQNRLNRDTSEILLTVLNREGLETKEEMQKVVDKLVLEYKYNVDDISFTEDDGKYYLTVYDRYTSIIGTLSFGFFRNKEIMVRSSYIGYYNEYSEAVVEKEIETVFDENSDDIEEVIID